MLERAACGWIDGSVAPLEHSSNFSSIIFSAFGDFRITEAEFFVNPENSELYRIEIFYFLFKMLN